jgi:hypothetical protein
LTSFRALLSLVVVFDTARLLVFYSPAMDNSQTEHNRRVQEFLGSEYSWKLAAGEANFLIQLLAFLVQENPAFVPDDKGVKRPLNYQSIRSIVLLNEKLSGQLQKYAAEASVILGDMTPASERVQ